MKVARKPLAPQAVRSARLRCPRLRQEQGPLPIAGDRDLYDIRRPDGTEIPIDEYNLLILDMQAGKDGVMRPVVVRQHQSGGGEGLVRFAPGQPMVFVVAATSQWKHRWPWRQPAGRPD